MAYGPVVTSCRASGMMLIEGPSHVRTTKATHVPRITIMVESVAENGSKSAGGRKVSVVQRKVPSRADPLGRIPWAFATGRNLVSVVTATKARNIAVPTRAAIANNLLG